MHEKPRWYNAVTSNCTTSIRTQRATNLRKPWDWRILLNGKMDEMLYQDHAIATGGLPFSELKERGLINVPQTIRVGGHNSRTAYDFTLQGPDTNELYREAQKLEVLIAHLPEILDGEPVFLAQLNGCKLNAFHYQARSGAATRRWSTDS